MYNLNNGTDLPSNDLTTAFDHDYGTSTHTNTYHHDVPTFDLHSMIHNDSHQIFHFDDPLKHVHDFQFKPLTIDNVSHVHFVKPHSVQSYVRKDGTVVNGYYRDGDGDTSINRTLEQGGGYYQSNPDGVSWNNLK